MVKTLADCLYKIKNTWSGFHNDMEKTKSIFLKNLYPSERIESCKLKVVRKFLNDENNSKGLPNKRYKLCLKLPYVGVFSRYTHKKIKRVIKNFCKDKVSVNLVFVTYKIGRMFSTKNKIPFFSEANDSIQVFLYKL